MADHQKTPAVHEESAGESKQQQDLTQHDASDVDNYDGLHTKTVLVYISLNLLAFAQILNLVGSGAYARDIATAVGGSTEKVWLSQAIAILTCVLGPPVSQAADYWGRKWFICILTLFGVVGSIIVSRASSMGMAIAGEVICGISYGSQPLLYAVASEILPRKYRPGAQAGINFSIALAGIFSLLVGSTLVANYTEGFRIFWYITAIIMGISTVICALLYNPPPRPLQTSLTSKEKLSQLDWIGYTLLASGISLLSMGLSWAENPFSWKSPHVLAPLLLGLGLLVVLTVHQSVFKNDGMFNHQLFKKDRNFVIALFCIFVEGMVFFAANGFYIFEVSVLYETDPVKAGLRFCVAFFASLASSVGIALYSSSRKKLRVPMIVSFLSFVIFNAAQQSSSSAVWAYPILLGFGLGVCLTCIVTAAQLSAPPELIAITSGLLISTRSLGGSVALAIYTAIYDSSFSKHLGPDITAAVIPLGLSPQKIPQLIAALAAGDVEAVLSIPGVTPQIADAGIRGLRDAYLKAFRFVWVTAGVFSLIAAIASCFTINPGKDLNRHVDAPLENGKQVNESLP